MERPAQADPGRRGCDPEARWRWRGPPAWGWAGWPAQSKRCVSAARSHAPGCACTSQPREPACFLTGADAVPPRCHQHNCQPLSGSVLILLAPGAAEQLVGGIRALTTQFLKKVCLAVSNPSLLRFLVVQSSHMLVPTDPQGPPGPTGGGTQMIEGLF